jgi:hypothetical protein
MVWFGALVAVTMQTAYLSPPVAMSAYYLKQVVKDWSLGTIYKGMFQFMVLQCIAIAGVMFVRGYASAGDAGNLGRSSRHLAPKLELGPACVEAVLAVRDGGVAEPRARVFRNKDRPGASRYGPRRPPAPGREAPRPGARLLAHIYGNFALMKTTIELPDELLVAAKQRAAALRLPLRALIERGLRQELAGTVPRRRGRGPRIRWVTVKGGLPPGLDVRDRTAMHEWLRQQR